MYWLCFWIWGVIAIWASIRGHRILRNHSESSIKWIIGVGILSFFIFGIAGVHSGEIDSWPYHAVAAALSWYGILGIIEFIQRAAGMTGMPKVQAKLNGERKERLRNIQQERLARLQVERANAEKQADILRQTANLKDARREPLSADELVRISSVEKDIHDAAVQSKQEAIEDLLQAAGRPATQPNAADILHSFGNRADAVEISGHSQYLTKLKRLIPISDEVVDRPVLQPAERLGVPAIDQARRRLVRILSRRAEAGLEDSNWPHAQPMAGAVTLSGEIQSRFGGGAVKTLRVAEEVSASRQSEKQPLAELVFPVSPAGESMAPGTAGPDMQRRGEGRFTYQPKLVTSKLGTPAVLDAPDEPGE